MILVFILDILFSSFLAPVLMCLPLKAAINFNLNTHFDLCACVSSNVWALSVIHIYVIVTGGKYENLIFYNIVLNV